LADLHREQKTYDDAVTSLDAKSKDDKLPQMKRSMAANELAQLKGKDPLPLNTAKLKQAAALKRVEAERKKADEATHKCVERTKEVEAQTRKVEEQTARCVEKTKECETQKAAVEEQTRHVEAEQRATEAKCKEAENALEEMKKKGGIAHGTVWWMEREVHEAKKYLPVSKGGIVTKK